MLADLKRLKAEVSDGPMNPFVDVLIGSAEQEHDTTVPMVPYSLLDP